MKRHCFAAVCLLLLSAFCCPQLSAQDWYGGWNPPIQLTYNTESSKKLEQVTGDCDWTVWDATIVVDKEDGRRQKQSESGLHADPQPDGDPLRRPRPRPRR